MCDCGPVRFEVHFVPTYNDKLPRNRDEHIQTGDVGNELHQDLPRLQVHAQIRLARSRQLDVAVYCVLGNGRLKRGVAHAREFAAARVVPDFVHVDGQVG